MGVRRRRKHRHRWRLSLTLSRVVFQYIERTVRRPDLYIDRLGAAGRGSGEHHARAVVCLHDAGTHAAVVRRGVDRIAKLRERHAGGRGDDELLAVLRECQLTGPDQRAAAPGVGLRDQFVRRRERQHFDRVGADGRSGRGRCAQDRWIGRYGASRQHLGLGPQGADRRLQRRQYAPQHAERRELAVDTGLGTRDTLLDGRPLRSDELRDEIVDV